MDREEFLKKLSEEGILMNGTLWSDNFKRLKELKKYKGMWEELEGFLEPGKIFVVPEKYLGQEGGVMQYIVKTIKQKYFPKLIDKTAEVKILINIANLTKELTDFHEKLLKKYFPIEDN